MLTDYEREVAICLVEALCEYGLTDHLAQYGEHGTENWFDECMLGAFGFGAAGAVQPNRLVVPIDFSKPNTELSFGAYDGNYDFLVNYRRTKPLNRFQIWMFKVCFGVRARNI